MDGEVYRKLRGLEAHHGVQFDIAWLREGEILSFSTDHAAAFEAVAVMQALGYTIWFLSPSVRRENVWLCTVASGGFMATTGGQTVQLAICNTIVKMAKQLRIT